MREFRPKSDVELGEWIKATGIRSREEGVPAVTGDFADSPLRELATLPRWCVSTSELSEISEFRPRDLTITVGSGMRLSALARTVGEAGLWLPLSGLPGDQSVGGWIASAPVGEFDGSFGPVRRHVLACDLLLWDGRMTRWGRPVMKNVAGYEIPKLICGSRARLGIVTTVTLRLWPRPRVLRRFTLEGDALREPLPVLGDAPALDGIVWRSRAGEREPATAVVSLTGGPASVSKRTEELTIWAGKRDIEILEDDRPTTVPGTPDSGRHSRPGTSAAYRVTLGRRYLEAGLNDLDRRLAREMDPWTLEAYPATGVIRLLTERQKAAGQRHAPAWLTTLADSVGRAPVSEPTLDRPCVRIERGGEAEHEAARRMRSTGSREIEDRWLAAFGGVKTPWQADYL